MEDASPKTRSAPPQVPADALEVANDRRLGSTPRARDANEVIRAMTKAARAYTIYDAQNERVREFIGGMVSTFSAFFQAYGPLVLEVRPDELTLDGEAVYQEADRERSLANRLFRDGVRELSFGADTSWRELVALLEILSIRFVGLRQTEDDLVTLFAKAELREVRLRALEGVVTASDDEGDHDHDNDLPDAFDRPRALLEVVLNEPAMELKHKDVPDRLLAPLRAEVSPGRGAEAVCDVFELATRAPQAGIDLAALALELQELTLLEGDAIHLSKLSSRVAALLETQPTGARASLTAWREALAKTEVLGRFFPHLSRPTAAAAFVELVRSLPRDPLALLCELVDPASTSTPLPASARLTLQTELERLARERPDDVLAHCLSSRGPLGATLLHVVAAAIPDRGRELIQQKLREGTPEEQLAFLDLVGAMSHGAEVRTSLSLLLASSDETVRRRAFGSIVAFGEAGAYAVLAGHAERRASEGSSDEELADLGRGLASVDPARAVRTFATWAEPPSLVTRWTAGLAARLSQRPPAPRPLAQIACHGLARLASDKCDALLASLANDPSPAVRAAAAQAQVERASIPAHQRLPSQPPKKGG